MEESKFDRLQRFFINAIDRMGVEYYEILEMGCHPNNFYLKVDIEGTQYELSEVEESSKSDKCSCNCSCSTVDLCKVSEEDKRLAIELSQRINRNSIRY